MKIAILGTGMVGRSWAAKLAELNHDVTMGTKNVERTLSNKDPIGPFALPTYHDWQKDNSSVKLATFADAAANGDIVINATNGMVALQILELAGEQNLAGKILIDVTNAAELNEDGIMALHYGTSSSLGEQIQTSFPKTKVVKMLNIVEHSLMVNPNLVPGNHAVFIAGEEEAAKDNAKQLLQSFGWREEQILDLGGIIHSRATEAVLPLWWRLYQLFGTGEFGFEIKTKLAS